VLGLWLLLWIDCLFGLALAEALRPNESASSIVLGEINKSVQSGTKKKKPSKTKEKQKPR
jgi:hypothetical protein